MIVRLWSLLQALVFVWVLAIKLCLAAGDATALMSEIQRSSNDSLQWGPYRPGLYFGVRPRVPKSLMAGLMWARVEDFQTVQNNFRHTCEQGDQMAGYGWDEYDGRTGGRQTIHDIVNGIDLTTEFVKIPGGTHGGSWAVRVKGVPRTESLRSTVVFYAGLEGFGSLSADADEADDKTLLRGMSSELGEFVIQVTDGPSTNSYPSPSHAIDSERPLDRTIISSMQVPEEAIWQARSVMFSGMKTQIESLIGRFGKENPPPPWQLVTLEHNPGAGNLHFVQRVFEGTFEFDIVYTSVSAGQVITSDTVSKEIKSVAESFAQRFKKTFSPKGIFKGTKYEKFSQSLFSNLIGGIGYFHGDYRGGAEVRAKGTAGFEGPAELFTSIPSRPFFPRGFLWDEGFHLLPIADWDIDLTLDIVKSWFSLIDQDGWIGREQILGPEARSKVPDEFQTQYPHYANPPTLFLVLDAFLDKLVARTNGSSDSVLHSQRSAEPGIHTAHLDNPEVALQYLRDLYPQLKKHYQWFRRTQYGDIKTYDRTAFSSKEAYRWRGRTPQHILTSGLDDYPRAQPPHPGELHVDLISWMGLMTRSLKRIAEYLGEEEDASELARSEEGIIRNIDDLHWSEKEQTFCDATIDDYEEHALVCHKGYVSLFPFMTGLLPADSKRLKAVLDLIEDPEELWSKFGIRSLSKKDAAYGTDENYWKSPIWVNMNYMIIWRLLDLAKTSGPHQKQARRMYIALRRNLVENVYKQWESTGFAWEQYNPEDGHGQRTQHFTGWTSLVVKIMAWPGLEKGGHDEL